MPATSIPADAPSRLPRRLGLFSAVAVLIGSTIGSGIFRSPAGIADKLPGPLPLLSVWLFGGVFVMCGALTLAEVASALPATGGLYVFIREAWGRRMAFLFGWSELLLIRAASLGAISTTFAEYLFRVLGHEPSIEPYATYVHWVAALAIALTATFNYIGLKWGSLVQNLTTVAKYGGLLFIVIIAIALGLPHTGRWDEILNTDAEIYGGSGVGNLGAVEATGEAWHGLPASAVIRVPPLAAIWLRSAGNPAS